MAVRSDTRIVHTITVDLPDDVLASMQVGDDIEVTFRSRVNSGRMPAPIKLSWSMKRFIFGDH